MDLLACDVSDGFHVLCADLGHALIAATKDYELGERVIRALANATEEAFGRNYLLTSIKLDLFFTLSEQKKDNEAICLARTLLEDYEEFLIQDFELAEMVGNDSLEFSMYFRLYVA